MRGEISEKVALDLLSIPSLIFRLVRRKVVKPTLADTNVEIKSLHFEIMHVLKDEGTLHPAKIGEKLLVAKAQMTHLIDKLVDLGFVKREMCADDRRTINLTLTDEGRKTLDEQDSLVVGAVEDNMASLSEEELENLSKSLRNLRDTLQKIQ
ncbi:MAG: MarR family transcriptional regulator [Dehalococcoidales bacterium]|nr:MarR family transcriptional regulator [Dehalococcoidales bacterium]